MNAIIPATQTAVSTSTASAPDAFLQLIERASRDPEVNLDKLQQLLDMRAQECARIASLRFHEAMTACQAELEPIRANCTNPQTHSRYADLAALDAAIRPIYGRHGFSLSFSTDDTEKPDHVRVVCRVYHRGGHNETHRIDMPADGKGARGNDVMTKTHAVASGVSYGRRYITLMIFNLMIDRDDDGNGAGSRQQRGAPPPRQRPSATPPYDPQTGEIIDKSAADDFLILRDAMKRISSASDLFAWGQANSARVQKQPPQRIGELQDFYKARMAQLRQPQQEAAE